MASALGNPVRRSLAAVAGIDRGRGEGGRRGVSRQFSPKGTDFSKVSRHQVKATEELLNNRLFGLLLREAGLHMQILHAIEDVPGATIEVVRAVHAEGFVPLDLRATVALSQLGRRLAPLRPPSEIRRFAS